MRSFRVICLLAVACFLLSSAPASRPSYLFSYFKNNGETGVYFALGEDGYKWQPLNGGSPWIAPAKAGELMRDPYIARGPDGEFHMVWTWNWTGTAIGYAHSKDLVHWSEQVQIPLMAAIPGTQHAWAPEIYWDGPKGKWLIIWSSKVEGRQAGNCIYSTLTADFREFSRPAIFFDPGFDVIDATIFQTRGRFFLFFKDEREDPLKKRIYHATGHGLEGPWTAISDALTETWSEGPEALQVGAETFLFYDHYRSPQRYTGLKSNDLTNWIFLGERLSFPEGARHGGFLTLAAPEAEVLRDH